MNNSLSAMQPMVSVIVPCYNYAKFLCFALESLVAQDLQDWECIIVDDGSSDNTKEVAEGFARQDKRFRYIYQQNQGLSGARNTGIRHSTGRYLQFLDADDLLNKGKLALQSEYLQANDGVDIVYGDELFFNTENPAIKLKGRYSAENDYHKLKISGKGECMVQVFCTDNFISVSSPLIKREIVDKVGYFDTSYKSYEDWHFWFRCAVAGLFYKYNPVPGTETYIRLGHASMMTNTRKLIEAGIRIRKFMMPRLPFMLKGYNAYRLLRLYAHRIILQTDSVNV